MVVVIKYLSFGAVKIVRFSEIVLFLLFHPLIFLGGGDTQLYTRLCYFHCITVASLLIIIIIIAFIFVNMKCDNPLGNQKSKSY